MSGMKFRVQCSACGATFFSADRKARICPKCAKKRSSAATGKPAADVSGGTDPRRHTNRPLPAAPKLASPKLKKESRKPKTNEILPEQIERLQAIYRERFSGGQPAWAEMVKAISDELWVNRKIVSIYLRRLVYPEIEITSELRAEIIARYKNYVEHNLRPPGGRRKTISAELGVPYLQVRNIVYEWSQRQFKDSPTPELSRELRYEIEKLYWSEIGAQRLKLDEMPAALAAQLGLVNSYQVSRWIDTLHDDDSRFSGVPAAPPEIERQVIDEYKHYLVANEIPENGLHKTIAEKLGNLSSRQVHMILQKYRNHQREIYPLK